MVVWSIDSPNTNTLSCKECVVCSLVSTTYKHGEAVERLSCGNLATFRLLFRVFVERPSPLPRSDYPRGFLSLSVCVPLSCGVILGLPFLGKVNDESNSAYRNTSGVGGDRLLRGNWPRSRTNTRRQSLQIADGLRRSLAEDPVRLRR